MVTKTCRVCKRRMPLKEFVTDKYASFGVKAICKACYRDERKTYPSYRKANAQHERGGKPMKRMYDHVKLPEGYASEQLLADRKLCADLVIAIGRGSEEDKMREVLKPGAADALERVLAYTERSGLYE